MHSSGVDTTRQPAGSFLNAKIVNSIKARSKSFLDSPRNSDLKMIASRYATVREGASTITCFSAENRLSYDCCFDSRPNLVVRMPRSTLQAREFSSMALNESFSAIRNTFNVQNDGH